MLIQLDKYYCSDLSGLILILTCYRPKEISYIICTNTYSRLNANIDRDVLDSIFESLPIDINIIETSCYVPPVSKRIFGFLYYKKVRVNGNIYCMANTLPLLKTKDSVNVVFDPQSLSVHEINHHRNKKRSVIYKIAAKLKNQLYPKISSLSLIPPSSHYAGFYKSFDILHSKYTNYKTLDIDLLTYFKQQIRSLIVGVLDQALAEITQLEPDLIYLPAAELSDEQTLYLFKWQLSNIPNGSKIFIKNHPRDKRIHSTSQSNRSD